MTDQLKLGSCPDSWGVWYADDPRQPPWERFLDELARVGYEYVELGPYGYLPTDANRLQDELGARGLRVAGGTMHGYSGLHRADEFDAIAGRTLEVAALTAALGGGHLVFVPVPGYRDDDTGAYLEPAELTADEWRTLTSSTDRLGPDGRRGARGAVPVPPARRQPRRDPRAGRPVPRRHRPGLRLPLPGHRAPRLPTRGQRRADP